MSHKVNENQRARDWMRVLLTGDCDGKPKKFKGELFNSSE
jgi:hypothetical protein